MILPKPYFRSIREGGFTLTELMVVIVVIAILAALLLSITGSVRSRGDTAKCIANLRNIGIGLSTYMSEHNGKLVPGSTISSNYYWFDALTPYMGYPAIIRESNGTIHWENGDTVEEAPLPWQLCPAKPVAPNTSRRVIGYGWNYTNFGYTSSEANKQQYSWEVSLASVPHPARTIIVGDSQDIPDASNPPAASVNILIRTNNTSYPHAKRHSGKGNYLFLDGHVESFTPEYLETTEGKALFTKS